VEVSPDWLTKLAVVLHEKSPTARLLVAGTPVQPGLEKPFHAALRQAAAQQRIAPVVWLGYVDQTQLAVLYRQIGCAIFPAQPTPLQQAKCSVRLATTLLAGVPVVASAVGEQATYGASGAAHLVAAEASPEEFADALCQLLADPARQVALSSWGHRHLLAQYSWPTLGNRLHSFYLQLLAASKA
jgi:glycosyltransferase involved in cell wall biosynthesis